jgi:hypothetical protein
MREFSAVRTGLLAAAALVAISPVVASGARAEVVRPGEEKGLGLTPSGVPEILQRAKADPYSAPAAPACETIPREIAALDEVLGPDADAPKPQKASDEAGGFITDVLKSFIPHRSIVRMVTGASKADKERSEAAMAGWTRRGYLKGMEINLGCAERAAGVAPPTQAAAPTSAPAAPPLRTAAAPPDPRPATVSAPEPVTQTAIAPSTEDAQENAAANTPAEDAAAPGTLGGQMALISTIHHP